MGQAQTYTLPAPSMGLDMVSPIDQMDPAYALDMVNLVAGGFATFLRNGYQTHSAVSSSQIVGMQGLNNLDGSSQLIVNTNSRLYRVTSGGVSTNVGGPYSATPFQSDTFTFDVAAGGAAAFFCNGVDNAQIVRQTGSAADVAYTGATLNALINVSSYRERVYFVQKNTMVAWYSPARSSTGVLASNDFSYSFKDGGFLVSCGSYTNNESNYSQDLFYALSSEGEVVVYQGSYPGDTTTPWGISSRYKIGRPVGYNCTVRVGNDTWIITNQGIVSLALLFSSDPLSALRGVGKNINPHIVQQALAFPFSSMWSGVFWPQGRRVFITIPTSPTTTKTLVYHMDGGWSFYSLGMDTQGLVIATSGSKIYYGGVGGTVWLGETGQSDGGLGVSFKATLPYNFFGSRGNFKAFKDVRPLMKTSRSISLGLGVNTDFKRIVDPDIIAISSGAFTPWGPAWGSPWSSEVDYIYDRHSLHGQGTSAALRIVGSLLNAPLEFYGFEIGFEPGSRV